MITIKKASLKDAENIIKPAREIYKEHYLHLWLAGGAEWYMTTYAYAPDKIEKELADTNIEYYLLAQDGNITGYMKLVLTTTLPDNKMTAALEIERIYLHQSSIGKGFGKKMMELALLRATQLQKEIIFLKAMDSATNAMSFYKSIGYSICGNLQLPLPEFELMKKEYRGMVILKRKVAE